MLRSNTETARKKNAAVLLCTACVVKLVKARLGINQIRSTRISSVSVSHVALLAIQHNEFTEFVLFLFILTAVVWILQKSLSRARLPFAIRTFLSRARGRA